LAGVCKLMHINYCFKVLAVQMRYKEERPSFFAPSRHLSLTHAHFSSLVHSHVLSLSLSLTHTHTHTHTQHKKKTLSHTRTLYLSLSFYPSLSLSFSHTHTHTHTHTKKNNFMTKTLCSSCRKE